MWLTSSFGGHIVAHLAIGHSMWGGYFLLPLFVLLVLELDGGARGRWSIAMGATLAAMLLQGSFHAFVWCVLFLLVRLCSGPGRGALAAALGWAALLGLARLAPAAAILQARREAEFQTGFPGLVALVQGLAFVRDASVPRAGHGSMGGLQWWEFDMYVGPAALLWLLVFGARGLVRDDRGRRLAAPVAVVTLLSFGRLYAPVTALGVPLLSSQRVTSRFLILPLLALAVMAALESSRWAAAGDRRRRVALWCAAAATAVSLGVHTHAWRMSRVEMILPAPPHAREADIEIAPMETDGPKDGLYVATVRTSAALSAAALGVALWRWRRR